ncbi:MAG: DUF3256 family protein [Prevotella sp.]|nr:DUF3256 family protein [Prevotella sp.]
MVKEIYRVLLTVVVMLFMIPCQAQPKMREVFQRMPAQMLPYLTENSKLDFIDFIDSGMKAEVRNELGGKSEMLSLTDVLADIQLSPSLRITMHIMPVNEAVDSCNQVVCVITTYGKDSPESKVEVYSVQWKPLDVAPHLSLPQEPYVATFKFDTTVGLSLCIADALDPRAFEEQEEEFGRLKYVKWVH